MALIQYHRRRLALAAMAAAENPAPDAPATDGASKPTTPRPMPTRAPRPSTKRA